MTRSRDGEVADLSELAVDLELDPAFRGLGGLPEQQGGHHRVTHGGDDAVRQELGQLQLLGGELDGLLRSAHLDQGDHGVQAVGRLVVLGAQGLGQAADDVELTGDRTQLGVVAQRDHGTDLASLPRRGRRAHDERPIAREVDVVGGGGSASGRGHECRREAEVVEGATDHVVGEIEQATRLVVGQLHPALAVEQQQSLAYGVEDGRVVLVHPGDLGLPEPVRLPSQPAPDQPCPGQPDQQHGQRGDQDQREVVAQPAVDRGDRDADRDQGHDLVAVPHRDHRPHRGSQAFPCTAG